jgi:hypothetical protein
MWALANRLGLLGTPPVGISPGLDEHALAEWRAAIRKGGVYLEYGSGGSTIEAVKHASTVVSVDTDKRFLKAVERKIAKTVVEPAPFIPVHADIGWTEKWGRPLFKKPSSKKIARWRNYSSAPWETLRDAGLVPAFILIDGRFRTASALESLIQLPANADCLFMLDDFAQRKEQYDVIMPFIAEIHAVGRALIFRRAANFRRGDCAKLLLEVQSDPE